MQNKYKKIAFFLVIILVPVFHLVMIMLNTVLNLTVLSSQLWASILEKKKVKPLKSVKEKFISVHLPIHNEPPEVVKRTLKELSKVDYKNFEVIVIDNNTADPAVWKPVEKMCVKLGNKFRFFHVENLKGFKSGALNYIRDKCYPDTDYILVLDADYRLRRNALKIAMSYVSDENVGLIQFPQSYVNVRSANRGLALDFMYFFLIYMNMANHLDCVPSTGTISFIRYEALKKIGGFNTKCITEDAELGFKINKHGYRGVYVNKIIGKGLMPYDLESFKKQRKRWAFGNMQIIKRNLSELTVGKNLSLRQKFGFLVQLTAWTNFTFIPLFSILFLTIWSIFFELGSLQILTIYLSAINLVSYLLIKFTSFYIGLKRYNYGLRDICKAYLTHLGFTTIFALSWVQCVWNDKYSFERTNKFIRNSIPSFFSNIAIELVVSAISTIGAVYYLFTGQLMLSTILMINALSFLSILYVFNQAAKTRLISTSFLSKN